jgi:hypothetical protein
MAKPRGPRSESQPSVASFRGSFRSATGSPDETGEWEIVGRPYTTNAGKDALLAELEEFVRDHRPHGTLTGEATEPAWNGYLITVACPCGVVLERDDAGPGRAGPAPVRFAELSPHGQGRPVSGRLFPRLGVAQGLTGRFLGHEGDRARTPAGAPPRRCPGCSSAAARAARCRTPCG